jgi:hypothetical protein
VRVTASEILKLEDEYQRIDANTLLAWKANPLPGNLTGLGYDAAMLGFSSGSKFAPFGPLKQFLTELNQLSKNVDGLDVLADSNLHFTFLALSPHLFSGPDNFPDNLCELRRVVKESLQPGPICLSRLRLVPLPNAIVLAGVPNTESVSARKLFADALLKSGWADFLRQRYGQHSIPPRIWHTTLVRADRQYLHSSVRDLFHSWKQQDFGSLELESPKVAAVTYNWSRVVEMT